MQEKLTTLGEVLRAVSLDERGWLYLPKEDWSPSTRAAVLRSDEVPPDLEDEPDAGVPAFALEQGLRQVLPISVVQEVIENAREQKQDIGVDELIQALVYYFRHDAFITL